jgi:glycosyltransferase involved in cell wall biosynthesis
VSVSVLILTLNEEVNLPRCLSSLAWCDDVVILDSYSSDKTVEIAKAAGVQVFQREFDDYATQRNFGLNDINYKHPWVLMVDADEEVPPELNEEVARAVESAGEGTCLFRLRRKDHFLGKWIRRSSGYPTWFGRLVKLGHVRVERAINEEYKTDGEIGFLEGHFHHYPFNNGFSAWFEKHNRYSAKEAELMLQGGLEYPAPADFFCSDPATRRRAVKEIVYHLPFRPLLMFLALYIFRGGFLDGRAGFTFCLLRSFYEFMINCKVEELRRREKGLPV